MLLAETMRILLVNKFLYPRGGAERAVLSLGEALAERGHDVRWFGMQHPENSVAGERVGLVRRREYRGRGAGRFRDAASLLYSWEARRKLGRLLDAFRPDVVHMHSIYHQLTPSVLDATRSRRLPVAMTLHDYKLVCPRYDMLRDGKPCDACIGDGLLACVRYRCGGSLAHSVLLAAESALHRARGSYDAVRRFFVPSRFLVEVLVRAGWDRQRLYHLPHFSPAFARRDASPVAAPEGERFLYAGRLSAEKGLGTLVEACRRLDRGSCIVCGSGPLEGELRRAADSMPPGRLQIRGHLGAAELWQEMQRSRFTVLPSECFENAPLAILESMAQARAVLASDVGGVPELIDNGTSGVLVAPGDVAAWTAAIGAALDAPEELARMGTNARDTARERFDFEDHLKAIESVYAEVAS